MNESEKKLFHVDSDPNIRAIVYRVARQIGYVVEGASDMETALDYIENPDQLTETHVLLVDDIIPGERKLRTTRLIARLGNPAGVLDGHFLIYAAREARGRNVRPVLASFSSFDMRGNSTFTPVPDAFRPEATLFKGASINEMEDFLRRL